MSEKSNAPSPQRIMSIKARVFHGIAALCIFAMILTTATSAGEQGAWLALPDAALPENARDGTKIGRPSKGAIIGVTVDRTTGDIFALLRKGSIWKSTNQGETFKESNGPIISGGGVMYASSFNLDPAGKRMACFVIRSQGGVSTDSGETWSRFPEGNFDFGAVNWDGEGKAMLAMVHESKGKLMLSTDGGVMWADLGQGFGDHGPIGIFDNNTLVATKNGKIVRSTDTGATWTSVATRPAKASQVIYTFAGRAYLLTETGLFTSRDKGATWTIQGSAVHATIGPFFGKSENDLAAVGPDGIYESADGGKTWNLVAPPAPEIATRDFTYAWDPIHNIFYGAKPGKPTMKCVLNAAIPPAPKNP